MASSRLLSYDKNDQICPGVGAFTDTFLKVGDHIRMEVEGLGVLENLVTERNR